MYLDQPFRSEIDSDFIRCHPEKFEQPMYVIFPLVTKSSSARNVSSTGVVASKPCM